ncbi:MAG: UTP-glucose-1-phosphate uridylyltransferase [Amphiamblys sp. WSBS2006]|nr:MAG: UTP-glucose-1-phosphate uridylyltransferase [Amphiamblys sp. WSBS2006]
MSQTKEKMDGTDELARLQQRMDEEIGELIGTGNTSDTRLRQDLRSFQQMFNRFAAERDQKKDWDNVTAVTKEQMLGYSTLEVPGEQDYIDTLKKIAVVKLNGGLSTTMGCDGPKSLVEVKDGKTFLDLIVDQIERVNKRAGASVPLLLMSSFHTAEDTREELRKYRDRKIDIRVFEQSKMPRIHADTLMPLPRTCGDKKEMWYPPGHADLLPSLKRTGMLDSLLAEGREYIFVSNTDNLGAVLDDRILAHIIKTQKDFTMEVTEKTKADIKGGTLVNYNGRTTLLEVAQVPKKNLQEFYSSPKFKVFNTNNLWISLRAAESVLEKEELSLGIIVNRKTLPGGGEKVIQLETAIGAAISLFSDTEGIIVPRTRFLPVKDCCDLLPIQSNLYTVENGHLTKNPERKSGEMPKIRLGPGYKKMEKYAQCFEEVPDMLDLDTLVVDGNVSFGKNTKLSGTVLICADKDSKIDIPSGSHLADKIVTGNLSIKDF